MPENNTFIDQIVNGTPYALVFGGQATPWRESLKETTADREIFEKVSQMMAQAEQMLSSVNLDLSIVSAGELNILDSTPNASEVTDSDAVLSVPGILAAQYAAMLALQNTGLDLTKQRPVKAIGHSQGVLAVEILASSQAAAQVAGQVPGQLISAQRLAEIFAVARLIGAAATRHTKRLGISGAGEQTPMLSVRGARREQLQAIISQMTGLSAPVTIGVKNERNTLVVSGSPADLSKVITACQALSDEQKAARAAKQRGGSPFDPVFNFLPVTVPFHSPLLDEALTQVMAWAEQCALPLDLAQKLGQAILTDPVDWPAQVESTRQAGAQWLIDLGPGAVSAKMTTRLLAGTGIGLAPAGTAAERDSLYTAGHTLTPPANWDSFAPRLLSLPTGKTAVDTAFTRLTGRSPVLLAGMTPTTVDPEIVAAAANAGHWAELGGGGQVTEAVFAGNLAGLKEKLAPGRAVQFNAMFFDRYLWNLQFGTQRIVSKARAAGAPFDGVVISAGIPELEEATAMIANLQGEGFPYVAFKPGTVDQILQVVAIARSVPTSDVIVMVEDGHAGGHHSWEDLDDLLLSTYATIRDTPNLVLCVGGGIGTPELAADYISGQWSLRHDNQLRPVDGVMVGTAAMTCLEAKTTRDVKELLVRTSGISAHGPENGWVGSGESLGGMTSGLSHLRADMYEIDNSAAACTRLIAEVEGDLEKTMARRADIIDALNRTAKPFFGEVGEMTYSQWAARFAALCEPWIDETWVERYYELLQRIEARLCEQDQGQLVSLFSSLDDVMDGQGAVARLVEKYPAAESVQVTPVDAAWFISLCRSRPRPMPFVPVIDGDLLRWWGSDSLWQSQDPRYTADQVRIIPGPVSLAGVDRIDEPVGELLGRFEAACVDRLVKDGRVPAPAYARIAADGGQGQLPAQAKDPATLAANNQGAVGQNNPKQAVLSGPELIKSAPHIMWMGGLMTNPTTVLQPSEYEIVSAPSGQENAFDVVVRLDTFWDDDPQGSKKHAVRRLLVPLLLPADVAEGGSPVVDAARLPEQMYGLLAATAGVGAHNITGDMIPGLPVMEPTADTEFGKAEWAFTFGPYLGADHAAVTANSLPLTLATATIVPDALLGQCWPAIYAALGSAMRNDYPVIEGLLNAVHLDHSEDLRYSLDELIDMGTPRVTVKAWVSEVLESSSGRVVVVSLDLLREEQLIAHFVERFAIRGRVTTDVPPKEAPSAGGGDRKIVETPRSVLRRVTITSPADMTPFANVSGDFNPIHTSTNAAKLAGMSAPLVHGMWLSAAAQHIVSASDAHGKRQVIVGWTYSMYGPVELNAKIDVTVERVGRIAGGGRLLEVTCRINKEIVSRATAATAPVTTAYVYPGQGIQKPGMGLDERTKSKAVDQVWLRADAHTRAALGFSILTVVRDNPQIMKVRGTTFVHPEGVLNLTQFTQVAMATLAYAQTERLREADALVDEAYFAGHSLGEYTALSAYAKIIPLETVLELVFHRGSTMHHLVERDAQGRSNYQLGALRPNQCGVSADEVFAYVSGVAEQSGEFLEIVNYNLAGQQYAVAGTPKGLAALNEDASRRAAELGGKGPFMLVPGVDVPFHSSVLRNGVAEFREKLELLLPADIHGDRLVGRYIPNLVARPFALDREFVQSILAVVPAERLQALLDDPVQWEQWASDPVKFSRLLLVELLCWQFASPVRWIETQDLLFSGPEAGGLSVEHLVEVGLGSAPTLANLAAKTLQLPHLAEVEAAVYNLQRDESYVYDVAVADVSADDDDEDFSAPGGGAGEDSAPAAAEAPAPVAAAATPVAAVAAPAPAPASGGARPADLVFKAADAVSALLAYTNKIRPDQIGDVDTTETLTNGVSSRRNQLLMDMSSELNLAAIDGAAEATVPALRATVDRMAHNYKPFGPVLGEAIRERVRKLFGPAGAKPARIAERVRDVWQLGEGWVSFVTVEILLGTREGASVRGGDLATVGATSPANANEVDALIDAAIQGVGAAHGVSVSMPSGGGGGGATVDAGALAEIMESVTGESGVLAQTAKFVLEQLGITTQPETGDDTQDAAALAATVSAELGQSWEKLVTPAFSERKAVLLDDRWASAREDLATLYVNGLVANDQRVYVGAGEQVAAQATWWALKSEKEGRHELAAHFRNIAVEAGQKPANDAASRQFAGDVAVVTGMTPSSIAGSVVAGLLAGGATVVATASRIDDKRLSFAKQVYREHAAPGAKLWLVPANLSSYRDVDSLVEWIGNAQVKSVGGAAVELKPPLLPTLFFPFAAPSVHGNAGDAGPLLENQMRLLLWSVERALTGLAAIGTDTAVDHRLHVILPGSPNRGIFGGDGAYGEAKASFDALVNRWKVEKQWASRVSLAHPRIGWVRGTGLMGGNDPLVKAVEEEGVRTYSTAEIAQELLSLCGQETREAAAAAPVDVDLTGGLGGRVFDMAALRAKAEADAQTMADAPGDDSGADNGQVIISALPSPVRPQVAAASLDTWGQVQVKPEDMVVIVGLGEVSTWGSGRTRFEAELGIRSDGSVDLTPAGVLELAWMMGLLSWEDTPVAGWYNQAGELVEESEIFDRFRDEVAARSGVRSFVDDGPLQDLASEEDTAVFLNRDVTFSVSDQALAESYAEFEPNLTRVRFDEANGEWEVTRLAGSQVRVPRRAALTRTVGGQFPTGFDPAKWGIPASMMDNMDRMAVWNLVTAVDAFISAGFSPAELLQAVHPVDVACTQGTGFGGMSSMRKLFVDRFLGEDRPQDVLQETLPNVIAAHTMQAYIGGYGTMIHPVGACATAAVSVEEGADKIMLGKASFVVAGAIDDISVESLVGFGDMNATALSQDLADQGINERFYSRANDRRRAGFVEAQGGGTVLLARGDIAMEMGLPVYGVVAYSHTFADGAHTSIPAPGIGALASGRGGKNSALAKNLASLGVEPDDIAVVSKHDTSTNANDPNENELHTRLAAALGRTPGNPLFVISQKTLTGHAKGGACQFQIGGLCQLFDSGIIPANRSLDCVDSALAAGDYMVWLREPLNLGSKQIIKAGIATSLGFGHISSVLAIVHPGAFMAAVGQSHGEEAVQEWLEQANDRLKAGARQREAGMLGHAPLYEPITGRRFAEDSVTYDAHEVEAAMLLDPAARLGQSGTYQA